MAISSWTPTWIQEITDSYIGDPHIQDALTLLSVDSHGPNIWHYLAGNTKKEGKDLCWIPRYFDKTTHILDSWEP